MAHFFLDLYDPKKRSVRDLIAALGLGLLESEEEAALGAGAVLRKTASLHQRGRPFQRRLRNRQLPGPSLRACLVPGMAASGHYVRSARSPPPLAGLETFLAHRK